MVAVYQAKHHDQLLNKKLEHYKEVFGDKYICCALVCIRRKTTMYEVGRVCVKIAGRDSNKYCVIVEKIDERYVLIDGQTRRKKVNMFHLEPTSKVVSLAKGADTNAVAHALKALDIVVAEKSAKESTHAKSPVAHKQTEHVAKKAPVKKSSKAKSE
jgi:large subunit ribosomal protein L14e